MLKFYIIFSLCFLFIGCATNKSKIDIQSRINEALTYHRDLNVEYRHQVILSYKPNINTTVHGLAVPISPNTLITAAHVVDTVKLGEYVNVTYKKSLFDKKLEYKALIKEIDIKKDLAILEIINNEVPLTSIPKFCKPVAGNLIGGGKPTGLNGALTGLITFQGVATDLYTMPLLSVQYNNDAKKSGYSPRKTFGDKKVVSVLTSEVSGGNSGGAIFDFDQGSCVVGIASLVMRLNDLEDSTKVTTFFDFPSDDYVGTNRVILIGVPLEEFALTKNL
ncbi:trypsin-like peptidase domain-containing protein [Colwellia sp. PAMC 21821]|uniref:trypsin-like peptidase domain-containing protein n=1 Tax=Colwellia sp. PAMC 21821 TaxID=1816219 RepID=UPI0009BE3A14|nr:trypsin-like peptidase domain-containing protein [Colwellia sp. PAMC 21821]ARD42873.1 hypothetical protein A3Q33_00130 [Colwellia sp. PAMC 21821]